MTRFSSRARTTERGFALIAVLTLAVLYFALMELLLIDSSRELAEARNFRARVVAAVLAENAAELAAMHMVAGASRKIQEQSDHGTMTGTIVRTGADGFEITAEAVTSGVLRQTATVFVQGRVESNGVVKIDYTMHGQ
ncbi:MAG TPA: hypothetical protein VM779_02015 [Thermoanaerobaculia bacterium]|nr:hypothetical protein [Thermoanaerobaculia bacterium]